MERVVSPPALSADVKLTINGRLDPSPFFKAIANEAKAAAKVALSGGSDRRGDMIGGANGVDRLTGPNGVTELPRGIGRR